LSRGQIVRAALLLMLGNLASRLLGLGREAIVVGLFGLSASTSAFLTAATVPTMIYDLLVGGAISAALIPVLADYTRESDLRAFGRVAGALLALTIVAATLLVLALEFAAPALVAALGAARRPEVEAETLAMVRLILPSVVLLAASGVLQAILQSRSIFRYTAASAAAFNFGIIAAGLTLGYALGPPALVVGVLLGAALQLAIQLPGLRGVPLRLWPDPANPGVRRALALYAPVAAGLVVSQVAIVIDRNLAWQTGEQSIAVMRSATTLVQLPLGLIATATSFAVLPALARAIDEPAEFAGTLAFGVRLALLAMVPMTVGLVLLREPTVRLLFERLQFGPDDTRLTAEAFLWYAPQMPFWAVDQLLIFAFYARKDTLTPVAVGVVGTLLYLLVAFSTVAPLGVFGLILANTIQNSAHCLVMYWLLWRAGLGLGGHGLGPSLLRALGASLALAAAWLAATAAIGPPPASPLGNAAWLVGVSAGMALAGLAALGLMRAPELTELVAAARRRRGRRAA
jgi:putative peptidoglycan lipid II flippase